MWTFVSGWREKYVEKKIVGLSVKLRECEGRRGSGEKSETREDACAESSDEDGGEERRNVEAYEQAARGSVSSNVFAGHRLWRKRLPPPGRKKDIQKNFKQIKALVKRIIPYIFRNRVWTLDDTQWPMTMENFRELDHNLAINIPNIHAGHQWQMILYF